MNEMASTYASNVRTFFDKHENDSLQCKNCNKTLKDLGKTTNLLEHLQMFHPSLFTLFIEQNPIPKECETQAEGDSHNSTTNTHAHTNTTEDGTQLQSNVNKVLVKMICLEFQSLGMVENSVFKDYCYQLNPNYTLPSRKMLSEELLPEQYNQAKDATNEKLDLVDSIAVSTDLWSSDGGKRFLTLTIHFIFQAKYETLTLSTKEMTGADTSKNIADKIREVLENEWKILDKVVCITTNDLPEVRNAVTIFLKKPHQACVAHALDNAVKECIKDTAQLSALIEKCCAIVARFKENDVAASAIREIEKKNNLEQLNLNQVVSTRFNSVYIMLDRLEKLQVHLSYAENSLKIPLYSLHGNERRELSECVSILKPVEELTTIISGEQYPTLSCIIPLVFGVQESLNNKWSLISDTAKNFKNELMRTIEKNLGCYETNATAAKATLMDPRFKKLGFGTDQNADSAQKYLVQELTKLEYSTSSSDSQLKKIEDNHGNLWNHLNKKVFGHLNMEILSPATFKVKQYVEQPYLDLKSDPLKFWEDKKPIDSGLYKMSQKYLCIPATSVPPKRFFSEAGLLYKQRISRLESDKIDQILFLNSFLSAEKR